MSTPCVGFVIVESVSLDAWDRLARLAFAEFGKDAEVRSWRTYKRLMSPSIRRFCAQDEESGVEKGMVAIFDETTIEHDAHSWWITDLCVYAEHRGTHVGTSLMHRALSAVRELQDGPDHKRDGVRLSCKPRLVPFYARFGFVEDTEFANPFSDTFVNLCLPA